MVYRLRVLAATQPRRPALRSEDAPTKQARCPARSYTPCSKKVETGGLLGLAVFQSS